MKKTLFSALTLLLMFNSYAQNDYQKIYSSDTPSSGFSKSLAIEDDVAIATNEGGDLYFFRKNNGLWAEEQKMPKVEGQWAVGTSYVA
ncbi:MAG: hypothetical protein JXR60_02905 [Bacteroidales bacterium]|nr:hypothetical protein [Bacteroidales bacterium]